MSTDIFRPLAFPSLADPTRDKITEEARILGHSAGYASGLVAAREELAAVTARMERERRQEQEQASRQLNNQLAVLGSAAAALGSCTLPVLEDLNGALLVGSLEVAEALLGVELSDSDTSARAALARALDSAPELDVHTVRMNPADLSQLDHSVLEDTGVRFVPDSSLGYGDAVATYPHGFLDARLTTAIDRARTALKEASA